MKTLTAAMTAHINRDVTTLTTIFKVTRTDGVVVRVTAHDTDISFAGETYSALSGVSRSAIKNSGDMKVDNLNVQGVLGLAFTDEDLRNGLFDYAEVEIITVNWVDPDRYGGITSRKGRLGEVKLGDEGYEAELRGLTQLLARRRGNVYQGRCRVNLFSPLKDPVTGQNGCGLVADDFKEQSVVLSVVDRRQFVLPTNVTRKFNPSPVGIEQTGVTVDANGVVKLLTDIEEGTPARSIGISTPAELDAIRNDPYAQYHLENDIDMSPFGQWTPIPSFWGVLDGRGHAIKNMLCTTNVGDTGFIDECMGVVRRVAMSYGRFDPNGSSSNWVGSIAARLISNGASGVDSGQGLIEECLVQGRTVDPNGGQGGGIVGQMEAGAVLRNCMVVMSILGTIATDVGAVVGRSEVGSLIENVYFNTDQAGTTDPGNVLGTSTELVGLLNSAWVLQASFAEFDFFDTWIMESGSLSPTLTIFSDSNPDTITVTGVDPQDLFHPGEQVVISGSTFNDGTYTCGQVTSSSITLIASDSLTAEGPIGGVTLTVVGSPRILDPGRF